MNVFKLNGIEITLPSKADEILLSQYIPFKRMYDEINKLQNNLEPELPPGNSTSAHVFLEETALIVQSLYLFIDSDKIDLYECPVNKKGKGLIQLYDYILKIISEYKPLIENKSDYIFTFNGATYTIKGIHKGAKTDLSLIESIEILEGQRIAGNIDKSRSDDARYSSMIRTLAVLSRKGFEKFPTSQIEINSMIESRSKEFLDIPFTIAMDAAFFLTFILSK